MERNKRILAGILAAVALACGASLAGCGSEGQPATESAASATEPAGDIDSVDAFYETALTAGQDIRNLPRDYTLEDARADGCFVISGAKVYNDGKYEMFMENCGKKADGYVRVALPTTEGDVILYDILYDSGADKVYLVCDTTRDSFGAQEITLSAYDGAMEYRYQGQNNWILYRGAVTDETFQTDAVFLVAPIS